ncbi:MAG: enoyl-CoA hydratase/isomerase family protein [Gammaproteobacteria bacterium]|nr:enoyl-CoA hydratase/isomerase family protein [Gammaproteobacteria bacterium]
MPEYEKRFSSESIRCSQTEGVLNFEFLSNRVDYTSLDTIAIAVSEAHEDLEVRAIAFLINADGDDPEKSDSVPQRLAHRVPKGSHGHGPIVEQDALTALRECTKPLIAYMCDEVNGVAIDLAAACDIRIANKSMTMCDTRILQGRAANTGISYLLPKLIGQSQAMRILLLGDRLNAEEAHRIHFVHEIVEDAEFDHYMNEFSNRVARMATRAWQVHKMQVLGQQHLDYESAMIHSLGIRQTHVINDRTEGMKAWRERRDPEFSGT